MDIFTYQNYKTFLRDYIKKNKHKGLISQIALICGCDRTYISQVLKGKADLIPDHMVKLTNYLNYSETESEYLLYLLLKDRSSTLVSKNIFEAKVKKVRELGTEISNRVKNKKDSEAIISETHKTAYYANFLIPIVHTLTSIENFQSVESISKKLRLPENEVFQILNLLEEMRLVIRVKDKIIHSGKNLFLERSAPQILSLHLQPRLEAVKRSQNKDEIHYTNMFAISKDDLEKIKSQIFQLIEEQRKSVHESGAQIACVFCCDFFVV